MPHRIKVQHLFDELQEKLRLTWVSGTQGGERQVLAMEADQSTGIIAGPLNYIHPNRVQVIGRAENNYLHTLTEDGYREALNTLFQMQPAAVVMAGGVLPDAAICEAAEHSQTPLLVSPLQDNQVLDNLQYFAALFLSEKTTRHGVFLEVLGMGVLLTGDPAVGKSELALELISRGSRLIADDAPEFIRIAPDIISGTCPSMLRDFLEVRGLGILNIRKMFGDTAIKQTKYLRLIVHLKRMSDDEIANIDRLAGSYESLEVLGVAVDQVSVPVAPGRNLAILVEAAVRNHMLRLKGYDATEVLIARQQQLIREG